MINSPNPQTLSHGLGPPAESRRPAGRAAYSAVLELLLEPAVGAGDVAPHERPHRRVGDPVEAAGIPGSHLSYQASAVANRVDSARDGDRKGGIGQRGDRDQVSILQTRH